MTNLERFEVEPQPDYIYYGIFPKLGSCCFYFVNVSTCFNSLHIGIEIALEVASGIWERNSSLLYLFYVCEIGLAMAAPLWRWNPQEFWLSTRFPPQLPEKCAQATLTPRPASIKPILPQTCHAEIQMFPSIHPLLELKYLLGFVGARTILGCSLWVGISTCLICKSIVG